MESGERWSQQLDSVVLFYNEILEYFLTTNVVCYSLGPNKYIFRLTIKFSRC
jgi:hypothetical protein